ncbi:MAG: 50S ribosomal protein L22 [Patescibacteria group bacterium]|nr:50S ribosomal protein L22 [Patescibacteria group bacterium]MDD5490196.1 50S ribosomal protein L22 [Patescibacteria group bacterium]
MKQVQAKARFIRMSPKKIRLVINLIRGLDVTSAESQLRFMRKDAAGPVLKLLRSAMANAEHNFQLDKSGLFIKEIRVDQGPSLKRWTPKAQGRATPILKRSAHISIVLETKEDKNAPVGVKAEEKPAEKKTKTPKIREKEVKNNKK